MAYALGNGAVSNYFRKRLTDMDALQAVDPDAAAIEHRRIKALSDYMAANEMPAQLGNAVQNRMIANPGQQNIARAAQSALYDVQSMFPRYGGDVTGALAAQALPAYLPQYQQHVQPQGSPSMQRLTGKGAGADSLAQFAPSSAVGMGMVNGKAALYPYAGRAEGYRQEMAHLGLDPGNINTLADPGDYAALQSSAFSTDLDKYKQMQGAKSTVQAAEVNSQAKLNAAIQSGQFRVAAARVRADGAREVHLLDAQGREHVAQIARDGRVQIAEMRDKNRLEIAGMHEKGLDSRALLTQDRLDARRGKEQRSKENVARIRAGQETIPEPTSGGGWSMPAIPGIDSLRRLTGQGTQMGEPGSPYKPSGGYDLSSGQPAIYPREYDAQKPQGPRLKPAAHQVLQQIEPFARQKLEAQLKAYPQMQAQLEALPEDQQMQYLQHLVTGK